MSRKQTPLCLLCTIVERGGGQRAFRTYEKHGIALHYRISGEGTASSDLLDLLGFGTSERDILISPARRSARGRAGGRNPPGRLPHAGQGHFVRAAADRGQRQDCRRPAGRPHFQCRGGNCHGAERQKTEHDSGGRKSGLHRSRDGHRQSRRRPGRHRNPRHILRSEEHDSFGGPHVRRRTANCWSSWPPARASATPSWKASTKPTAASRQPMPFSTPCPSSRWCTFPETKRPGGNQNGSPFPVFPPSAAASRRKIPFSCELLPKGLHPIC